jgi:hypothetical protein
MKKIFTILIISFLIGGFVLISGCVNQSTEKNQMVTTIPTTNIVPTSAITPREITPIQTTIPPTATTTLKQVFSSNDINRHFVDLAFGPDYPFIFKWNKGLLSVAINGDYKDNDVTFLNDFFTQFNLHSSTTKFPLKIKTDSNMGDIVIKIIPESALKPMETDNTLKFVRDPDTGEVVYVYRILTSTNIPTENLYINSGLKGDKRNHALLRALLYEMGFQGETGNYPNSFFYTSSKTSTSLNIIDWKAVELMYGKIITTGDTLQNVEKLLLINTN